MGLLPLLPMGARMTPGDSLSTSMSDDQEHRITMIVERSGAPSRSENHLTIRCQCGHELRDEARKVIASMREHRSTCGASSAATPFERRRKQAK